MDYRGRILDPKAYERADGSGWIAEIFVAESHGSYIEDSFYFLQLKYPNREAAMNAAVIAGKVEVDRRIAG